MKTLTGKRTKIRSKKVILYVYPFFNHWFGAEVYLKEPTIDKWGTNKKNEKPFEIAIATLFDVMGIKTDYEKFDYDYFKKKFENEEGGFKGGLMAEPLKVTGILPIDKEGNIIFAF